jgi:hypothetical protein
MIMNTAVRKKITEMVTIGFEVLIWKGQKPVIRSPGKN